MPERRRRSRYRARPGRRADFSKRSRQRAIEIPMSEATRSVSRPCRSTLPPEFPHAERDVVVVGWPARPTFRSDPIALSPHAERVVVPGRSIGPMDFSKRSMRGVPACFEDWDCSRLARWADFLTQIPTNALSRDFCSIFELYRVCYIRATHQRANPLDFENETRRSELAWWSRLPERVVMPGRCDRWSHIPKLLLLLVLRSLASRICGVWIASKCRPGRPTYCRADPQSMREL
ncbi:hypothetical protein SCOR_31900 [Sulfidibacter corallicola]